MRVDFIARRKGSLSLPITGIIAYSAAALLSLYVPKAQHNLLLTMCFWSILPLGAMITKLRAELPPNPNNPFFKLSVVGRVLALATWAIHIPVWIYAPDLFPLTIGIAFALHWTIFAWTTGHPLGFLHLGMRIAFVLLAWHLFPANRMGAVSAGIALAYMISVVQMSRVDWAARLGRPLEPVPA